VRKSVLKYQYESHFHNAVEIMNIQINFILIGKVLKNRLLQFKCNS